jgi:uracil phosphoribosyltransferase
MLDSKRLPLIRLTDREFAHSVLCRSGPLASLPIHIATDKNAAKLLATPMRNAATAGPALREAHRRAGWYLAIEFLAKVIEVEEYPISHVLGHHISGYRLLHENRTTIVALMRAGEPMAIGVSDTFPLAMFVHASHPADIKFRYLQGQLNVLLVDSVVNSRKTVVGFVEAVRNLHTTIRIAVVAGVSPGSLVNQILTSHGNGSLIALRISDTKFTGSGKWQSSF